MINNQKQEKMTFQNHFQKLKNALPEFRDKLLEELGISYRSFYRKLETNSFNLSEQKVIATIMDSDIQTLFPENSKISA